MEDTYRIIEGNSEGSFRDKGSRFIGLAFYAESEEQIREILQEVKKEYHSARHHCYAWRIGTEEKRTRAYDDGEPSSSAGKPILGQIIKADLTNILIVVVRYFGGVLLGVSGLINAYREAASEAIGNAGIKTCYIETTYVLSFGYPLLNQVMQVIKNEEARQVNIELEDTCKLIIAVKKSDSERIRNLLINLHGVSVEELG